LHHSITHPREESSPSNEPSPMMKRARGITISGGVQARTAATIATTTGGGHSGLIGGPPSSITATSNNPMRNLLEQLHQQQGGQQQQSSTSNRDLTSHKSNSHLMAILGQLQAAQLSQQETQQQQQQQQQQQPSSEASAAAQQLFTLLSNQQSSSMSSQLWSQPRLQEAHLSASSANSGNAATMNQWMAMQQLLGGGNISSSATPENFSGPTASLAASSSLPVPITQQQQRQQPQHTSPIMSVLAQILQKYHEDQRRNLDNQQAKEMQMLFEIQNNADPQQHMQFLIQLLSQQQQQLDSQQQPQPSNEQQHPSVRIDDMATSLLPYLQLMAFHNKVLDP
jgi:hypothetical protein